MKQVLLIPLLACAAWAQGSFRFEEVSPESLMLREGDRPVFVYNHGLLRPEGVPEDRARCCYVHPVWAPNDAVVTDDFPKDHYHHRGLFWAWPVVTVEGRTYDLWTLGAVRARFVSWLARETAPSSARLAVENGWFIGERKIIRETVEIAAGPEAGGNRTLDFVLRFEAAGVPVALRGDPTDAKGYGGFSARFAPRTNTAVTTDTGLEKGDSNMAPHPWAQLEAEYSGRRAALRIDDDPANPGFPNGWCLRYYGFLGVNYPGNETVTLHPGRPLTLRYRVTVSSKE